MKKLLLLALLALSAISFASETAKRNPNHIYIILKSKDFMGNSFVDDRDCAVARACKRYFKTAAVFVGPYDVIVFGNSTFLIYRIKGNYEVNDFAWDKFKADFNNPELFVNEIELIP